MISALFSRIWKYITAGALGVAALMFLMWQLASAQRDSARRDAAEKSREARARELADIRRQNADHASKQAKEQGDARVEEVRQNAGRGRRDHFERVRKD